MKKILQTVQAILAKLFGLPTKQRMDEISLLINTLKLQYEESNRFMLGVGEDMHNLRADMKVLYSTLESDIRNVKSNVKQIKPILKVEDEEAVSFIKGIFARHDTNMKTNHFALNEKMLQLKELEASIDSIKNKAETASCVAQDASNKIRNVLYNLGLLDEEAQPI